MKRGNDYAKSLLHRPRGGDRNAAAKIRSHLPRALADFKAEKAWRFWSTVDAAVHYAVYQFSDMATLDAAMTSDALKALIADFDENWPSGVTRTRDILTMAEERTAS